jgi:acyl-coenzyme A synthetase/AMP-(fatty) acid ligase
VSSSRLQWLLDRFRQHTDSTYLVWNDRQFSYKTLLAHISQWRRRLDDSNIGSGAVVSLEADYSPQALALFIALVDRGAIIVPLTPAVQAQRTEFRRIAEVQVIISIAADDSFHISCPDRRELQNELLRSLSQQGEPGLILFSSGSTGESKAALHNLTSLLKKFQTLRHPLVAVAFLMLDHIGGINTLFYVLSNAGTLVCPENRTPDAVCSAIAGHGVELLPTSPTFLNLLLISEAYKRHSLASLKRITYGTEVMPQRTLDRIQQLFPQVELQQTYGLSEIGILRSKSRSSNSLWVKVGGEEFQTKIEHGTLWVKAQSAMMGYLNAPSPFDAEGWLNTGDAVERDGDFIRILGRQSEIINVGGEKVHPVEVENVLLGIPNVHDVAVAGESNPITGQMVTARFNLLQPEEPASFRRRVKEYCRGRLAPFKTPAKIEIVSTDQYNARFKKIRRTGTLQTASAAAAAERDTDGGSQ